MTDVKLSITAESAHALTMAILAQFNVPEDRALLMADACVLADLRGVDTHGINRYERTLLFLLVLTSLKGFPGTLSA